MTFTLLQFRSEGIHYALVDWTQVKLKGDSNDMSDWLLLIYTQSVAEVSTRTPLMVEFTIVNFTQFSFLVLTGGLHEVSGLHSVYHMQSAAVCQRQRYVVKKYLHYVLCMTCNLQQSVRDSGM